VDPRHVLVATRDRAADPEPEGEEQLLEQATFLGEHQAGPEDHDAVEELLGLTLRRLPVDWDLRREALAGRSLLVDDLAAAVPVVPDRRLPHEHARLGRGSLDALEQVARADDPALADPDLGLVGEPLVDLLADQVDDAVDALECRRRRGLGRRPPGVPGDGRVLRPRSPRIASQPHDLIAPRQQGVAEGRSDQP
jgi:hypothetical protein